MNILSVILFAICIGCYTGQAFFNRLYSDAYQGPEAAAVPVFTIIYGIMVAIITLLPGSFSVKASAGTLIYGAANGIVLFLYYLGMIQAARRRPYSFRSIVMSMGSTVICIIASCAAFAVYLLMILLRSIPSYILYTINNGTVLVAGQILAAAVLKKNVPAGCHRNYPCNRQHCCAQHLICLCDPNHKRYCNRIVV